MNDDVLLKLLISSLAYARGVIPITCSTTHHDAERDLASLTPEERRVSKRKFRKLWRRAARELLNQAHERGLSHVDLMREWVQEVLGLGREESPTRLQKRRRRAVVSSHLRRAAREVMKIVTDKSVNPKRVDI